MKGKKKKKSKHDKKSKQIETEAAEKPLHHDSEDEGDDLTDAERKSLKLKKEREKHEIEKQDMRKDLPPHVKSNSNR